ncbi:HNH endonuclease [Glutamicibacter arilaitensis]|uniref:HNH endonuclease n=1 Tax=Glutamicibacter arilaitensis TaxID=256701 RepID=UPI0018671C48
MASNRTGSNQWRFVRNYHLKHARANGQTTCPLCNNTLDWDNRQYPNRPEVDHITPVALGGTNAASNLRVICAGCNRRMGAKLGRNIQLGITLPNNQGEATSTQQSNANPTADITTPLRTSRQW